MLVPWFNYNACSITRDSQGKRVQFARQHAKVRDFTSRHACLEVKFGFRQVQVCFIGGSLPVILSSMVIIYTQMTSVIRLRDIAKNWFLRISPCLFQIFLS